MHTRLLEQAAYLSLSRCRSRFLGHSRLHAPLPSCLCLAQRVSVCLRVFVSPVIDRWWTLSVVTLPRSAAQTRAQPTRRPTLTLHPRQTEAYTCSCFAQPPLLTFFWPSHLPHHRPQPHPSNAPSTNVRQNTWSVTSTFFTHATTLHVESQIPSGPPYQFKHQADADRRDGISNGQPPQHD